ncbi:MAG: hypothetical protein KDA60_20405, partial [Planctomycetales bacterium]|nr:hypothetical protein [Planctomycetales bacterium]
IGWLIAVIVSALQWVLEGRHLPLVVAAVTGAMMSGTLLITWRAFSRRRVSWQTLTMLPVYVVRKVPIYVRLLVKGPQKQWLRTERK